MGTTSSCSRPCSPSVLRTRHGRLPDSLDRISPPGRIATGCRPRSSRRAPTGRRSPGCRPGPRGAEHDRDDGWELELRIWPGPAGSWPARLPRQLDRVGRVDDQLEGQPQAEAGARAATEEGTGRDRAVRMEGEDLCDAALAAGIEPVELLSRAGTSRPSCSPASPRCRTRHARSESSAAPTCRKARVTRASPCGGFRPGQPRHADPLGGCLWGLRRPCQRAAPTLSARRRCAPAPERSFGCHSWAGRTRRAGASPSTCAQRRHWPRSISAGRSRSFSAPSAKGSPDPTSPKCDAIVSIPMPGEAESLNVAAAVAPLIYSVCPPARRLPKI